MRIFTVPGCPVAANDIVVNEHDGDKYGDKWLGGVGSKSYLPGHIVPAPPYVKGIFFIRIMEGGGGGGWLDPG